MKLNEKFLAIQLFSLGNVDKSFIWEGGWHQKDVTIEFKLVSITKWDERERGVFKVLAQNKFISIQTANEAH